MGRAPSAVVDMFPPLFGSHTWYVYFLHSAHCLHVIHVILDEESPPTCYKHCRGRLCTWLLIWEADLLLGHPHRFPCVQIGLEHLGVYHIYGFHTFLGICGKYFICYLRFSLIFSALLQPFILNSSARSDLFLGRLYVYYRSL